MAAYAGSTYDYMTGFARCSDYATYLEIQTGSPEGSRTVQGEIVSLRKAEQVVGIKLLSPIDFAVGLHIAVPRRLYPVFFAQVADRWLSEKGPAHILPNNMDKMHKIHREARLFLEGLTDPLPSSLVEILIDQEAQLKEKKKERESYYS